MSRLLWLAVLAGMGLLAFDVVDGPYVFGPLLGLAIWKVGSASFRSLRAGGPAIPDGSPPRPVDLRTERVSYWCEGCGAELLLLVRGTETPPRHCGERMVERREVARDALN